MPSRGRPRCALAAEDASAEVELRPGLRDRQRAGRAQLRRSRAQPAAHPAPGRAPGRPRNSAGSDGSSRRDIGRAVSLAGARQQRLEHQPIRQVTPLQIVAAIGQVEALVAEREVRDRLVPHRDRQREPVAERRIDDLVVREPARGIGSMPTCTISPRQPSTSERIDRIRRKWPDRGCDSRLRRGVQEFRPGSATEFSISRQRCMRPREHVAGLADRDIRAAVAIKRGREIPPASRSTPLARAGRADGPEIERRGLASARRYFRTAPESTTTSTAGRPHCACRAPRRTGGASARLGTRRRCRARRRPAGPSRGPSRLPHNSARQVQHIAAQPAAIGGGRKKPDIAGERPEIADMVGDPFQLDAQPRAARWRAASTRRRQGLRATGNRRSRAPPSCRRRPFRRDAGCACAGPPRSARSTPRCW